MSKEQMENFYRQIDVILYPTPDIPSLPVYEAKACGEPVIKPYCLNGSKTK